MLADKFKGEAALDENALCEAWADLGATFGAQFNSDRMSFALRSLTYPDLLSKVMTLAARQLAAPAFAIADSKSRIFIGIKGCSKVL